MDFLDPRRRKSRNARLLVGYFLVSIIIGLGTIILVYGAYGYGINTKTGAIIQNGILFVNSKPGGAQILLNDKNQNTTTAARLVLAAGNYDLTLKRSGYREWERKFSLDEHSISRYVYPFLFPVKPLVSDLKSYSSAPPLLTQSPDRHWLLVQNPPDVTRALSFDEYDSGDLTKPSVNLVMPGTLLADSGQSSQLSVVEWSTDNTHVLLKHTYSGGDEYIIFNRDKPTDSINVNKLFGVSPSQVELRNKKNDQLYIFDSSAGTVRLADVGKATLGEPLLTQVLAFKSYGNDLMSYVTDKGATAGNVEARIWDNGQTYPLYTFSAGTTYLIDAAQFSGHWYYVAGSNTQARINIYKDPINDVRNPALAKAIPILALIDNGANKVSFSVNSRFIEVDGGANFGVYDLETQDSYSFALSVPLAQPLGWLDGYRLIGTSAGQVFVMDYDSTNQQMVTETSEPDGGFLSKDFNHLITYLKSADGLSVRLTNVDLRAGTDLPKNP